MVERSPNPSGLSRRDSPLPGILTGFVEELKNPELTSPCEMEFPLQFLDLSPSIPLQFLDFVVSLKPEDFLDLLPS
jgi:hypothetical protein